ncbi:hypothetical protein SAMN04488515_2934 [Cognatiyoonia koreensis]|uniref:Uncharacterized protein n=1 Tax=Cognatiyoonia koreensis TaxID=364200 RepID=A0A1I0RNP7_9RHOB|nr:hypothetical protein [Cognatiyoonia koreensis]SEW42186.1 hypothetical protein SAMN04488515_2934 [Cognatiyoonia koreensis]
MIDKKALSHKLAALASSTTSFRDGARVISDGESTPILNAILHEIDATVLNRKLTFRVGKSYVTIVAGGRRLQGMTKLSGDIDGALRVMGKIVTHDDAEVMDAVAHVMKQVGEKEGELTVESAMTDKIGSSTETGVGVGILSDAWGIDMALSPPTPLGQFIINCGASVNASLVIAQGEIIRAKGDKAIQDKLQDIANQQWSTFEKAHAKLRAGNAEPSLICLNSGLGEGSSLAVAKRDDEVSLFCFSPDQLGNVYANWRETNTAA